MTGIQGTRSIGIGGTREVIPVFRPNYDDREWEALREPLATGWTGLGPKTAEFEERFAEFVQAPHAVAMNSGTAGLTLGVSLLPVEGREVVTTALTFVSTNHAIVQNGGIPVFADVDPDTLCLDPQSIADRITPRTAAIMVVDYGGHPAELDDIVAIAREHGIFVIEDAAHSCGARYRGRPVGSIADVTCFSFHAVKNLSTGEGGMVTVSDDSRARTLRVRRWYGIDKSTWERFDEESTAGAGYSWEYHVEEIGFKAHMSDVAASIGLVQLAKLEEGNKRRREIAAIYDDAFAAVPWVRTPIVRPHVETSQHNYVIRVPAQDRARLIDHLASRSIATSVHYLPSHLYPVYAEFGADLPVTDRVWREMLTIPLFPDLREEQIATVIDGVSSFKPSP